MDEEERKALLWRFAGRAGLALSCLVAVGWAAIDTFGVLRGLGLLGAVILLMPFHPKAAE